MHVGEDVDFDLRKEGGRQSFRRLRFEWYIRNYLCQTKGRLTTPDFCDRHRSRVSFRSIYEFWEFVVKPGLWREYGS